MKIISTNDPNAAKTNAANTFTSVQTFNTTVPDFPYVDLIDDFDRASLGSDWNFPGTWNAGVPVISGGALIDPSLYSSVGRYIGRTFGPDSDIVVEFTHQSVGYSEIDILSRGANIENTSNTRIFIDTYLYWTPTSWGYYLSEAKLGVGRNIAGTDFAEAMPSGINAMGIRHLGTAIQLWLRTNSTWSMVASGVLTNDTFSNTYPALYVYNDASSANVGITAFYAKELNTAVFEQDGEQVAAISAGGIFTGLVDAPDGFSTAETHTFTATQTFDPATDTDKAIIATGPVDVAGKLTNTNTYTRTDDGAKRGVQVTTNFAITDQASDGGEATAGYYEASLSNSSTKTPSWIRGLFAASTNSSTTVVPSDVTGLYALGQTAENADATSIFGVQAAASAGVSTQASEANAVRGSANIAASAVVQNARALHGIVSLAGQAVNAYGVNVSVDPQTGSNSSSINGIRVENISAANGTHSTLIGLYLGTMTGAGANYAIYSAGGQVFFQTASSADKGVVIRGSASQSANLQEWQDSSGTVVAYIDSNGNLVQPVQVLTDAATISWNLKLGGYASLAIAGNRTLANPTNMVAGAGYTLKITQDGVGSRTLAFGSAYKWVGGTPTLSTAAGSIDIISFISDGTFMYGSILKGFA